MLAFTAEPPPCWRIGLSQTVPAVATGR